MNNNGDQYTVTVSNAVNSLTSAPAIVTIGPRSPKAGDLRFKLVGASGIFPEAASGLGQLDVGERQSIPNAFTTPFQIGDELCSSDGQVTHCDWAYNAVYFNPGAPPIAAFLQADPLDDFDSDLAALNAPNTVTQFLDLRPGDRVYGLESLQIQGGQFDLIQRIVPPGSIASTAASDAAQSRVITAVSFDGQGQAHLMSYGWQGDTTTPYDTEVSIVAPQDIESTVSSLAGAGFIVTAFGGDDTNGYVLVGTKVHGDTLPRPIQVFPGPQVPGNWMGVARVSWVEYSSSGSITTQGWEIISEE